jgi:hypothetical protein
MAGKFIRTRNIVSRRARDDRRTRPNFDKLAKDFVENLGQQVKSFQFDLDLSIKAAPPKQPKKSAKPKRAKLGKEIWNVGGLRANKNRKSGLGNRFKIYITANELKDRSDRVNIGWVNPPIGLKPGEAEAYFARAHQANNPNKVKIKHRDVKPNPRTGNISAKSLGQTLDEIQPLAGVGTRAAARAGIVIDDAGRFRCPPGVPAANQFTDRVGSNCFNITPANKRKAIDAAVRKAAGFLSDIQMVSTLDNSIDGFNSSTTREMEIRKLGLSPDKTEELIKFAEQRANMIAKVQSIEESAIEQIRKSEPGFTTFTRSASGLTFDNDPIKVMESAIAALQESNQDLDLSGLLWTQDFSSVDLSTPGKLQNAIHEHTRMTAEHIWDQLFGTIENGKLKKLTQAEEMRKQKMINYALNFKENTGVTFVGDHELYNRALASYLSKQEGFMFSLLAMANDKPEVFKRFGAITAYSPNDEGFELNEATSWVDDAGNYTLYWNPLKMVVDAPGFGRPLIRDGEIRIFEPEEESIDSTESAILEEISKAADIDAKRLAIAKLFGYRMSQVQGGEKFLGEIAEEFAGDKAHAMFVLHHELAHHFTYDLVADAIRAGQIDGIEADDFETIEAALNEVIFAGDVAGVLPDVIESIQGQSTRDILNALSESGLAGRMPMSYMDEVWAFSTLNNAFKNGGEDAVVDELQNIESLFGSEFAAKMTDMVSEYITSDSKDATDFMKEWRIQQQTLVAELMSELYAAREFGIVDRNDERVANALRAIDVKETEITAGQAAKNIAEAVSSAIEDERGFSSSRIRSLLKRSDDTLNASNPNWLAGMTPREMAHSVVPENEFQMRSLISRSIFGTDFPDEKQMKYIDKNVKRLYGGWENLDFTPDSVTKMRNNMEQAFTDYPEFAKVAQKFGSPAFITVHDMFDTIVKADGWETVGFHNYLTRSILINPGIAGTQGRGGGLLKMSQDISGNLQENGLWHSVTDSINDRTNRGFGTTAIHEYGHWLSRTLLGAGKGEKRDIEKLSMSGLSDEMITALGKEHLEDGNFGIGKYNHLEAMAKEVLGKKTKIKDDDFEGIYHDVFVSGNGASYLETTMDSMEEPVVLTKYGIVGGAQEAWAEGFCAVVSGAADKQRLVNPAMRKAVEDVIGGKSDFESSVFAGFNSRRDLKKPVKRADIPNKRFAIWAERRKFDDKQMGALSEISKANEMLKDGEAHAAAALLSVEAIDGSGQQSLRNVVDQLEADSMITEERAVDLGRLVDAVSPMPNAKKNKDDFSNALINAKEIADALASPTRPLKFGQRDDRKEIRAAKIRRWLKDNERTVKEIISKDGFVPSRRTDVIDDIFTARQDVWNSASEPERIAMRAVSRDMSKTKVPMTAEDMLMRISQSAFARKLGNNEDTFDHELNNVIIPWHNLVRRTELGKPYRTQMDMRLSSGSRLDVSDGDIIDIPHTFMSDVLSGDSEVLNRGNGRQKIVILAHETDKGIPGSWGNDPEKHSTAITMPPSKLMVEHIASDGTIFVSIDQQNHIDPIHEISQQIEMASRTTPDSMKIESEIVQRSARQHRAAAKRGFNSSTAKKEISKKTGFAKYKDEAEGFSLDGELVSRDQIQTPSEKTSMIISDLEKSGATFAQPVKRDFIEQQEKLGSGFSGQSVSFEEARDYHKRSVSSMFDAMRAKSEGKEFYVNADTTDPYMSAIEAQRQQEFNQLWDRIPQEIKDHVNSRTNEELYSDLLTSASQFNDGLDRRVRVRIKPQYLNSFAEIGAYKTTHADDVVSEHSDSYIRRAYEVQAGIPVDAPSNLRPASGYVMHRDLAAQIEKDIRDSVSQGTDPKDIPAFGEFYDWDSSRSKFDNSAGIYGSIEMILNEDVSHRTGIVAGDSLNSWSSPSLINETDPEKILVSIASPRGKNGGEIKEQNLMLLQSFLADDYKYATKSDIMQRSGQYHEALIGGSFDASEVAEIRVPSHSLENSTEEMRRDILSNEFINSLGLTEEERDALTPAIEGFITKPSDPYLDRDRGVVFSMPKETFQFLAMQRNYRNLYQRLKEKGFNGKLTPTHRMGVNLMDPASYAGYEEGMELESLLRNRLAEDMKKAIKDMLSRANKPKIEAAVDF